MEALNKDPKKRIVLMNDNDEKRQLFETCNTKGAMTVNPIIDWSDCEIWDYINSEKLPCNPLYCKGLKRVGCIGCTMATPKIRKKQFLMYPKYEQMYIRAFDQMLDTRKAKGLPCDWQTGLDVFRWWMEDKNIAGQLSMFDEEGDQ